MSNTQEPELPYGKKHDRIHIEEEDEGKTSRIVEV
jgi:hypothetical protein